MNAAAFRDDRGRPIRLGEVLGAGGEGTVFALAGDARRCVKIFHPDKAAARAPKLRAMCAARPLWPWRRALAWPTQLLFDAGAPDAFAGFVMPAWPALHELYRLLVPDERLQLAGFLTARDLCRLAAGVARAVHGVHRYGHCVGDLKPQNILVAPRTGRVVLIDTDSFQIADVATGNVHASAVLTPEYTAPELIADPQRTPRTAASDAFALAVLIHQLLLGGAHPFEGELAVGRASLERIPGRIRRGLCPLVPGVDAVRVAAGALPLTALHPALRALFERCFGPGHREPRARPTPAEWHSALLLAARTMIRCPESPAHLHGAGLASCPWCERRARTGIDLFPAGQGWQRAVARWPHPQKAPRRTRERWFSRHVRARGHGRAPSKAERAWLLKTGAALGLDRATVTAFIEGRQRARLSFEALGKPLAELARWLWQRALLSSSRPRSRISTLHLPLKAWRQRAPAERRWLALVVVVSLGLSLIAATTTLFANSARSVVPRRTCVARAEMAPPGAGRTPTRAPSGAVRPVTGRRAADSRAKGR